MHLNLHRRMRKAVLIINTHAEYLATQAEKLGYKTFCIDSFNQNSLNKIAKLKFLKNFIKKIRKNHKLVKLIYGSGLEDKPDIYTTLHSEVDVQGNPLEVLEYCNDILNVEKALNISGLQIPRTSFSPLPSNIKTVVKPIQSYGGLHVNFTKQNVEDIYYQEFIPGSTFSISFFINKNKFSLLGFNKLFTLKDYSTNPFIHAGAMNIKRIKIFDQVEKSTEIFSSLIGLQGYNSIDFKIYDNKVFVIDINPRITSTFKIYNELLTNDLMKSQINLKNSEINNTYSYPKKFYGFVYMFSRENFKFHNKIKGDSSITNLPKEGEIIKKDNPIFTINFSSNSPSTLVSSLRKKISMTTKHYNCYDIDI